MVFSIHSASVLGGHIIGTVSDANDCIKTGYYFINTGKTGHMPDDVNYYLIVHSDGTNITQYANKKNGIASYQRVFTNGAWVDWYRVDNFGCKTASDLASLLGVGMIRQQKSLGTGQSLFIDTDYYGILCIRDETNGKTAIYSINNGLYAMEKLNGNDFSLTKDTPNALNIYPNFTSSLGAIGIHVQNLTSGSILIKYSVL